MSSERHPSSEITVLKGLDPVRKRPMLYVGDVTDGSGQHLLLRGLVMISIAACQEGAGTYVRVDVAGDVITVEQDGDPATFLVAVPGHGRAAIEVYATTLHHGAWPGRKGSVCSPRLHEPIELALVNALSEHLEIEIWDNQRAHRATFSRGEGVSALRDVGASDRRGMRMRWVPDRGILRPHPWNEGAIGELLRGQAALMPSLTMIYDQAAFRAPDGLADLVLYLGRQRRGSGTEPVRLRGEGRLGPLEVALSWTGEAGPSIAGFVNAERCDAGAHIDGLFEGLRRALSRHARAPLDRVAAGALREVLEPGLAAAVRLEVDWPEAASVRRGRLRCPEAFGEVADLVAAGLGARLREDRVLRERLLARLPR